MKILVVGAGAVGGYFEGCLVQAGRDLRGFCITETAGYANFGPIILQPLLLSRIPRIFPRPD
jgi:nucleoside-diphosphate-sugar epimerase